MPMPIPIHVPVHIHIQVGGMGRGNWAGEPMYGSPIVINKIIPGVGPVVPIISDAASFIDSWNIYMSKLLWAMDCCGTYCD